jgi:hypothetical protein
MGKYASEVVKQAQIWLGAKEGGSIHRAIIDAYNSQRPLPRGYAVKYTDDWCAAFVSAVAVKLGYTDIMPTECGCSKMISLYQKLGSWDENDARVPRAGDIIFYDWQDSGKGDNKASSDHVGIVEKVEGNTITVIEGNRNNSVERRTIAVNARYIRGYGVPKYDEQFNTPIVNNGNIVLDWQRAAIADGYSFPKFGADGMWGSECASVAAKAICKKLPVGYKNKNLTRIIQARVGVTVDGLFGKDTRAAVIAFQRANGLTPDGIVGINTWKKILGVK